MQQIKNTEFGGERPLFASHDLQIDNVTIHAGESALKECSNIIAVNCRFEGKYPFWHVNGFIVKNCLFTEGARAALWYSQNLKMTATTPTRAAGPGTPWPGGGGAPAAAAGSPTGSTGCTREAGTPRRTGCSPRRTGRSRR